MSTFIESIKSHKTAVFLMLFILSSLSFGLGYLYAKQENPAPILIQKMGS